MNTQAHPTLQALLADESWARGLARALVGDAGDDLLQDAYVSALRRPPTLDVGDRESLRPWFATVLRNAARSRFRSGSRRAEREREAARVESDVELPDAIQMRVEQRRQLAEYLLELPADSRTTLVLRFEEGLSGSEIARRTGTPEGTVRWRLKRGLDELRERLDRANGGDRQAWVSALLPLTRDPKLASTAVVAVSGLAWKLAAAAALAIVTGAVALRLTEPAESVQWIPAATPQRIAEVIASPNDAVAARTSITISATSTVQPETRGTGLFGRLLSQIGVGPLTRLRAKFVDADGNGVPNVQLEASTWFESLEGSSDAKGTLDMSTRLLTRKLNVDLSARSADWRTWESDLAVSPGDAIDLGTILMSQPHAAVVGRVIGADGEPEDDATIVLLPANADVAPNDPLTSGPRTVLARTSTSLTGDFEFVEAREGFAKLAFHADGTRWIEGPEVELIAGRATQQLELHVPADSILPRTRLHIVLPNGEPATGGMLLLDAEDGGRMMHDLPGEGGLVLEELRLGAPLTRIVCSLRKSELALSWSGELATGDADLTLALEPMVRIDVRVDLGSRPEPEFAILMTAAPLDDMLNFDERSDLDGGSVALPMLVPSRGEFIVRTAIEGFERTELGPYTADNVPQPLIVAPLAIEPIHGRVTHAGRGVAGAEIRGLRPTTGNHVPIHSSLPMLFMEAGLNRPTTNSDGTFTLYPEQHGEFVLQVRADGLPTHRTDWIDLRPGVGPLAIEMQSGGTLEGQLSMSDGSSPAGRIIAVTRGSADAKTVRVDSSGRYRFEDVAPGKWFVCETPEEVTSVHYFLSSGRQWAEGFEHPFNVAITTGATTRFDLSIDAPLNASLRGTLDLDDLALDGWTFYVKPLQQHPFDFRPTIEGRVRPNGDFEARVDAGGAAALSWSGPLDSNDGAIALTRAVGDVTAELDQSLELRTGWVELRVAEAHVPPNRSVKLRGTADDDRTIWTLDVTIHPDGKSELVRVPAGRVELLERRFREPDVVRSEGNLAAGSTLRLERL